MTTTRFSQISQSRKSNNMAIILLILMGVIPIVFSQAITTTDCGTNKACHKSPGSCTSSTDCDYLVTWKRKTSDNTIVEFEVSTKMATGWVALAFNPTGNVMIDSRGEICYIDAGAAKFKGFHATAKSRPTFVTPATNTALSGVNVVSGAIVCRFSRPVTPSGYQSALGPAVNLVIAAGAVSSGTVGYHFANKYAPSGTTIDFTTFGDATTQAPTTTTTQAPTTTTQAPTTSQASSSSESQSTSSAAMTSTTMSTQNSTTKAMMSSTTRRNSTTKAVNSTNVPLQTTPITTKPSTSKKLTTSQQSSIAGTTGMIESSVGTTTMQMTMGTKKSATTTITTRNFTINETTKGPATTQASSTVTSNVSTPITFESVVNTVGTKLPTASSNPPINTIDLNECGKTKGCFKIPSGCKTSDACTFIATWQANANKNDVMFEVKGSGISWVAFGLNAFGSKMPGTYGEICYMSGSTGIIKGYHAPKKSTPTFTASKPNGVTLHSITRPNDAFICRYTRSVAKTDGTLSISINKELYIVLASGDAINGGTPGYHGSKRGFSSAKFDVTSRQWGGNNANRQSASVPALVILGALQMMLLRLVL